MSINWKSCFASVPRQHACGRQTSSWDDINSDPNGRHTGCRGGSCYLRSVKFSLCAKAIHAFLAIRRKAIRFSFSIALLLAAILAGPAAAAPPRTVSTTFYAAAHPDDWQLFETPNAIYDALSPRNRTVFICFTAGDAGAGTGGLSSRHVPYFLARENASKRSVRFVVGLAGHPINPKSSIVVINGHAIHQYTVGRTISYFLRLPDGNAANGNGYPSTGMQSLKRLHEGAIASLSAIDGSATYRSWGDLVRTITMLIKMDARGGPTVWVNTLDPNQKFNAGSHPDHDQVGMAMQAAIARMPCVNLALFTDYRKATLPRNLSAQGAYLQAATFGALVSAMVDAGFPSEFRQESRWLGRNYFRTIKGTGACQWPSSGQGAGTPPSAVRHHAP